MRRAALAILTASLLGCGAATPPPETPEDEAEGPPPSYAVALRFADAGADENETPQTRVLLVRIAPDGERVALILARCWWAGAGARYEVRREGDAVIARRAGVDEMEGDQTLEEAARVEVPESARLEVLAPGGAPDVE